MNRVLLKGGFVVSADVEVGNVPECDVLIDGSLVSRLERLGTDLAAG